MHDAHPNFPNTRWARQSGLPTHAVWHHHAHAAALAGEFACDVAAAVLRLGRRRSWSGWHTLGRRSAARTARRVEARGSFRPFRLPGGERAAREPWRSALALCWELASNVRTTSTLGGPLLRQAFDAGLNAPATTAVGRLFDAAAASLGLCRSASYEGEAPMRLEALCEA